MSEQKDQSLSSMNRIYSRNQEKVLKKHKVHVKQRRWAAALSTLLITSILLSIVLPAFALDTETYCGQTEHTHTDECYTITRELTCGLEEGTEETLKVPHVHTDACYEYPVPEEVITYVPVTAPADQTDVPADAAQETVPAADGSEGAADDASNEAASGDTGSAAEAAGGNGADANAAGTGGAVSGSSGADPAMQEVITYVQPDPILICGYEEGELVEVTQAHVHTDACYTETKTLTCKIPEHTHTEACYSNKNAGVETQGDWEYMFIGLDYTKDWSKDLIMIAKTQLGYHDKSENFILNEDGSKSFYSRYGAWYGIPYGDWCAMFVSFCLNYAKIPETAVPRTAGCTDWVQALKTKGIYKDLKAEEYSPVEGDLVFFRYLESAENEVDHVGIISKVTDTGIITIEGNMGHEVGSFSYAFDDPTIIGYVALPVNPEYTEENANDQSKDSSAVSESDSSVEAAYPAVHLEAKTEDGTQVLVDAPEGAFPAGVQIYADTVEIETVANAVENAVEGNVVYTTAVDIIFKDASGKEIEPARNIKVNIIPAALPAEIPTEAAPTVVHIDDQGEATVVEQVEETIEDTSSVTFENNEFSVYVVAYTVDFEYATEGNNYQYSINGGDTISLSALVDLLGIANETGYETAEAFLSEVDIIEFSDSSLITVEEIDNDWLLHNQKAFDTIEALTISLIDGRKIVVIVRDAQNGAEGASNLLRATNDQNGSFTINKNWVDEYGNALTENLPDNITVSLSRDREKLYNSVDFVVRKYNGNNEPELARIDNIKSQSRVTLIYQYSSNYNQTKRYIFDGNEYTLPSDKSSGSIDVMIPYEATGTVYLDIRSDWGLETIVSATIQNVVQPSSSAEIDENYSENINVLKSENWEKSVSLPVIETVDGVTYSYTYNIAETAVSGGTVDGRKVTIGGQVFTWASDFESNDVTITNTLKGETTSVSVIKRWGANTEPARAVQFTLYYEVASGTSGAEQINGKYYKPVLFDADGNSIEPKIITAVQDGGNYSWPTGDANLVTWDNLPKRNSGTEIQYLIRETGVYEGELSNGEIPEGASWSSVKGFRITPSEGIRVTAGGTASFTNTLEGQDVKIDKTWDENVTSEMAWESTFVLEELEYPYADQNGFVTYDPDKAHDDAEHSGTWTEVSPRREWTISSSSSPQELTIRGLPKFRTKEDGKVYILMYSVTEIGYKVWSSTDKTQDPIYSWTKGGSYTGDVHFTPEYLEDADEYTDYTIEVKNTKRNEKEQHFIEFDLKKTWAPAEDGIDQQADSYAVFQLKRMSHQEFKNMADPNVIYDEFVTVRVVDGAGRELTSLQVEKNAEIKLQAAFKAGVDGIGTVDFINLDGTTGHVMIENPTALASQELKASNVFRVPADATFQYNAGEEYLAEGLYGIVISDRCDGTATEETDDTTFNARNLTYRIDKNTGYIITYSNGTITSTETSNGWTLEFKGFPQQLIDSGETRETTTVYGYYFEEVQAHPTGYNVTYYQAAADGTKSNVLNGDVNNRIYFDDHVIAENKKSHLTIKKYWESLVQSEMPNLVVDIKRVESDGNNVNVNAGSPSYKTVILTPENNFEYELYNLEVRRSGGGYYAYIPWELGFTTSKPGDEGVAEDGTITDLSKVSYTPISTQYFDNPTYAAAREGSTINYLRLKADNLARQNFTELSDKYDIITKGSGTICIVNNPKKTGFQLAIRKRWHKFTTAGGMTTESNYDGAYFTAMMVQIVKDASTGKEVGRHDYGSSFEWHYDGNTDFKYKDQGKETNVSIRYYNGQWLVVIPEGQGNDGSNLPKYGYYTKADGSVGVAEYDYTVRELSVTSMDGYHWAISDHIQSGSAQDIQGSGVNGDGHVWMLDNYPDADLKIIKHWPTKSTNQGASAVYFLIKDQHGNNVLDEIVANKKYKEHELTAGDVAQYNGQWCLVVRGPTNSTEDWIGYIDHLPLFDFSKTVFGNGEIAPGGMPGEINYSVKEVAALNSNGQLVDSSNLYIPFYQVTTRGTKGSIRASAEGIQLGMYDVDESGKEILQPTIVEVTNNATTNLEVEKRFYDVDEDGNISVVNPSDMTAWITEDGKPITRIDYIVKVDTYEGSNTEPTASLSGYVTENWKNGQELAAESGAKVFSLSVNSTPQTDSSGVYWSDKPDALQGLPSVRIINSGSEVIVRRYVYTIIEKAVFAGEGDELVEITKFVEDHSYDKHKEVWKLSNTRSKNEYTEFVFTKEWQNAVSLEAQNWPDSKEIQVEIYRNKNGENDEGFSLKYTITSSNYNASSITADEGYQYPESSTSPPELKYITDSKYSYKLSDLLKKQGDNEYVYFVKETTKVDGYQEAKYFQIVEGELTEVQPTASTAGYANDGGKIVNKEDTGYELPSTGGRGTWMYTAVGMILVMGAGLILLKRRKKALEDN